MSSPSARFLEKSRAGFSKMAISLVRRSTLSLSLPSLLSSLKSGMSDSLLALAGGAMIFLLIWAPMWGSSEVRRGKRKRMMFRRKLLAVFALTVFLSVAAVAWLVSEVTRRGFVRSDGDRTGALVTQFRREFNREGEEVERRVEAIAKSETASHMAVALNHAPADSGPYFEVAKATAENSRLDFLEFVESDGTII